MLDNIFARALLISLRVHSPNIVYGYTVHVRHIGLSETLLDPPIALRN